MAVFKAHQTAFAKAGEPVPVRFVRVPNEKAAAADTADALADEVFYYGQNDFQPVEGRYSVSVGDVLDLGPRYGHFLVEGVGFKAMTPMDARKYMETVAELGYRGMWDLLWALGKAEKAAA